MSSSIAESPNAPSPVNTTTGSSGRAARAAIPNGTPMPSVPIAEPMNRFVPGRWAGEKAIPQTTLSPPSETNVPPRPSACRSSAHRAVSRASQPGWTPFAGRSVSASHAARLAAAPSRAWASQRASRRARSMPR